MMSPVNIPVYVSRYNKFKTFEFNAPQRIWEHNTLGLLLTQYQQIHLQRMYKANCQWFMCACVIFDRLMHFVYHYEILMNFCESMNTFVYASPYAKLILGKIYSVDTERERERDIQYRYVNYVEHIRYEYTDNNQYMSKNSNIVDFRRRSTTD